jgi:hypothetical protein
MKRIIHTTISLETYTWISNKMENEGKTMNTILEEVILFYKRNKEIPEMFVSATFFLNQLIRDELKKQLLIKK